MVIEMNGPYMVIEDHFDPLLYEHVLTIDFSLFGLYHHVILGMLPNKELICVNLICIIFLRRHVLFSHLIL